MPDWVQAEYEQVWPQLSLEEQELLAKWRRKKFSKKPDEPSQRCVQCNSEPDGSERHHIIGGHAVLLHDECRSFFIRTITAERSNK